MDDETNLRAAFAVARKARAQGDHPFGAVLAGPDGTILMEQGNAHAAEGQDPTAHAERLLATRAAKRHLAPFLAECTLYSSAEPCAMCAGAIYWAGIGRVVYGQSKSSLKAATGDHAENPTLDLPCRTVFAAGQRRVEVVGPMLEDEAASVQDGFWTQPPRLTLDALNRADIAGFTQALGHVFEHAPWVEEQAAALRPFETVSALHAAMMKMVLDADADTQTVFLRGHPELAGEAARRATLAAHSSAEQASLGLDHPDADLGARFDRLNATYRARFGFPFIICVRRHTLPSILANFEQRLNGAPHAERTAALAEIAHITRLRLTALVDGPGKPATEGWLTTHVLDTAAGRPAARMTVALFELNGERRTLRAATVTNADGRTDAPLIPHGSLRIGVYELRFDVGAYFQSQPDPSFLGVVPIRFAVAEPETHYHVPLLVSPGAYSTYRGS